MSVTAYVLIQTEVGRAEKVAKAARDITGVIDADNVAGPYDVIVKAEAAALLEAPEPFVAGLAADAGAGAEFGHGVHVQPVIANESLTLFHR